MRRLVVSSSQLGRTEMKTKAPRIRPPQIKRFGPGEEAVPAQYAPGDFILTHSKWPLRTSYSTWGISALLGPRCEVHSLESRGVDHCFEWGLDRSSQLRGCTITAVAIHPDRVLSHTLTRRRCGCARPTAGSGLRHLLPRAKVRLANYL